MSDLISRSALIGEINMWAMQCNAIDSIVMLQAVVDVIEKQPTAYDVDKVVEELEDKLYESSSAHAEAVMGMCGVSASGYSGEISAYGKAIEIVRKGGVNE